MTERDESGTPPSESSPRRREAVRNAILDAAEQLLLSKNPNQISVREIAELAGVKHPMIHRHFGTKEKLILETHARGVEKVGAQVAAVDRIEGNCRLFVKAVSNNRFRQVALARALLEGVPPDQIQEEFPVISKVLELLRNRRAEQGEFACGASPEIMTAFFAAAVLGWFVHEPFLLHAIGRADADREEIHDQVAGIIEEIIKKVC